MSSERENNSGSADIRVGKQIIHIEMLRAKQFYIFPYPRAISLLSPPLCSQQPLRDLEIPVEIQVPRCLSEPPWASSTA